LDLDTVIQNKTVFVGNLEDPSRTNIVDLIGIITGMEDGVVQLEDLKNKAAPSKPMVQQTITPHVDRWDIPMVR